MDDLWKKGKYYVYGRLEFEGEYLYGIEWNGKGYDRNGNVVYEIINGKGTVRKYDITGNLIFEGEYLNGKRWNGIVKEYDDFGHLEFEEEYINGVRNHLNN